MPFYEFECQECKASFEFLEFGQLDAERRKCPKCGSKNITQIISSFGLGDSCSLGGRNSFG